MKKILILLVLGINLQAISFMEMCNQEVNTPEKVEEKKTINIASPVEETMLMDKKKTKEENIEEYKNFLKKNERKENPPLIINPPVNDINSTLQKTISTANIEKKIVPINPVIMVSLIKSNIETKYPNDFMKSLFFDELDKCDIYMDKKDFITRVNKVLNKYFPSDMTVEENTMEEINNKNTEFTILNRKAIIKITRFNESLYDETKKFLESNKYKYDVISIDLSDSNGGVLNSAVKFMNAFIDLKNNKSLFYIKSKNKVHSFNNENKYNIDVLTPIEIVINENTKNGALMTAQVFEEHYRGKIIGKSKYNSNKINTLITIDKDNDIYFKLTTGYFLLKYEVAKPTPPDIYVKYNTNVPPNTSGIVTKMKAPAIK